MEPGFIRGDSHNLPTVHSGMVDEFYCENLAYFSSELKNVKTKRAARPDYGDNAVGYVQVKRVGAICTVKGRITPEHRIRAQAYHVVAEINEATEKVLTCQCTDCPASSGGCKHGTAFLMWLHRRSEEPSVTSTVCYWRVAPLAQIGKHLNEMGLKYLVIKEIPPLGPKCQPFLEDMRKIDAKGGLFSFTAEIEEEEAISIHQMLLLYASNSGENKNVEGALNFMKNQITAEACKTAEMKTRNQSDSELWFELRFGRITASRVFEASRCSTLEGTLFETIMGASKRIETEPVKRGKRLESQVLDEVKKIMKFKNIRRPGIFIKPNYPIYAASPDGVTGEYCVEIKCPISEKTMENYIEAGKVKPKYEAQMLLQMFLAQINKGLFCVASPSFETSRHVYISEITFDTEKCKKLMDRSLEFWKKAIFPHLC